NSGANGLYSAGSPGLGKDVIGVASFDNSNTFLTYFEVNGAHIGYVPMDFAGPTPTSGSEEIVFVGRGCVDADTVTPGLQTDPYLDDPNGKVALISRGACSFNEKATRAITAGAVAVVIHNSSAGVFNGTLGTPIDGTTPVVGISLADGLFIQAQTAPVTMTWTNQQDSFPSPTGGLISSFSSYGLAPDLSLKPDIGAPGGNIYSTYPLEQGGYATLSGTSMSSPHTAGAAALLLEAKPNLSPSQVRDALLNSADPKNWSGNPGLGFLDLVHRQGAGMLDIDDAILATTTITPSKIATGEGEAGPFTQQLVVKNNGASTVTYDLSFEEAIATSGVITITGYSIFGVDVVFDSASVTVKPGKTAKVNATVISYYPDQYQFGGYIIFTPQGGGQEYRVPFAGIGGDYQSIQMLTPTPFGFPALGWTPDGNNFGFASPGDVFTMQGFDLPYILIHFEHQVQEFRVRIFNADGSPVHPVHNFAFDYEYLPRNSTTTSFFAYAWDGTRLYNNGNNKVKVVPDGEYYLVVEALKANGDAGNPAHWETWTSPTFVVDRP
ncbi:MAG: S8 family serine peptidase, partial [Anaerolineae bacterium]|nr:S8 family serine peptidase [Anaerolineae bacterium]